MAFGIGLPRSPAYAVVLVNQRDLEGLAGLVREITVQLKRNASGMATIVLDSFRDETGHWAVQDGGVLRPWDEVQINAYFDGRSEGVLHGYVREVRLEYPEDMSAARVTVTVQDDLIKLDRNQLHQVLSKEGAERSDGAIAREFAQLVNLNCDVAEGITAGALQIDTTPAKFLRERAEANGFEFFSRDSTLHFHPPKLGDDPQPEILVYAGPNTNCIRFSVHHDGQRPDRVQLTRPQEGNGESPPSEWEPNQRALGNEPLTSEGRGLQPFVWTIDRPTGATEAEVEARAQAKANENQFKIIAEGALDGTQYGHVLVPHLPVTVDGIGTTYGGRFYVDEVTHKFTKGLYEQQFKLLSNATN